ncbi:unnamed protein product [Brachionus calyciflorus]|uniref:Histone acetyltransferase type B catalytic subunit n=1 Tax=Brachionus calyciflorus TaxID=104777 RepID=A0A814HXH3_9BILA|nr:unnamed protein product [Brachionus calyciflorus]
MSSKLYEKLKAYKNYANDCIFFKYVFTENDIETKDESALFKPEYTHQIFGDDEEIFGYKSLRIDYLLTPGYLDAYIGLSCKEKLSPQRFDGIEPDDVYDAFTKFGCTPNFTRNLDTFCSDKLKADIEFKPFGQKVYEYFRNDKKFEIFRVDSQQDDYMSQKFIDYIINVQTMLIYYIETASFIDTEDPQWTHYLLYENKKIGSEQRYATIGYLSVYNYYAYPDKTRSRVSQVLVMPTYQKQGHGAELLQAVYRDVCENPNIVDVTSESPSQEFIQLRDYVTSKMCSNLSIFQDKNKLKNGFTNEMVQEALGKYKIPKFQSRRVYEIFRLFFTNEFNIDEWRSFRLDIKKRFYLPFIRKSKYARSAGNAFENEKKSDDDDVKGKLESKMSSNGETQIGFGSSSKLASINSRFFNEGSSVGFSGTSSGKKSVSFKPLLNTSNGSSNESDEEDGDVSFEQQSGQMSQNLFVSEEERKKYLEEQFQETVKDYRKIIHRLEYERILPF